MRIVLVHGWSVFDTQTYGELPEWLEARPEAGDLPSLSLQHVWLSKYISFRDEVQLEDLALAFESAFRREVEPELERGERFLCITHSTGGPVLRHWWQRLYWTRRKDCPMSHLVMLAPANFGSALAQLGKGRLGRLKSWWNSIEPGQQVLDWLEHASPESWDLNREWIVRSARSNPAHARKPVFLFVLTGQTIDRQLYDHVNSYTGESGSDGTVRVAAANLNATYVSVRQKPLKRQIGELETLTQPNRYRVDFDSVTMNWESNLVVSKAIQAARTAFQLVPGASHGGRDNGIMYSIKRNTDNATVRAILRCLQVSDEREYDRLCDDFERETNATREAERVEETRAVLVTTRRFFHDAHSLLMVRMRDDRGQGVVNFDFKLTGAKDSPDGLPPGFFVDRQLNSRDRAALTYHLNYDAMAGLGPTKNRRGRVVRERLPGVDRLGLRIYPSLWLGFAHYLPAVLHASTDEAKRLLHADATTLVDVQLCRILRTGAHQLVRADDLRKRGDFRDQPTGDPL